MSRKTQEERVLDYIEQFGSITTLDAFKDLAITRLSGKIYELRKKGYPIISVREYSKNRFGEPTHYDRYMLKGKYTLY